MFLPWIILKYYVDLWQHFLGETAVTLPQVYHHSSQAQGDLEPILRVCLLDPSFHALVEKVEVELRKLLQEWEILTAEGRKVKSVKLLFFSLYSLCRQCLECILLYCQYLKCCYTLVFMLYDLQRNVSELLDLGSYRKNSQNKRKCTFIFKVFIQKKNIGLTHMFDRGYILWSLLFPP